MKKSGIGPYIRDSREKLELTRDEAAKKLGISAGYLGHLERSAPVSLSDALLWGLIKKLRVSTKILSLQDAHNRRSSQYYKEYRRKKA